MLENNYNTSASPQGAPSSSENSVNNKRKRKRKPAGTPDPDAEVVSLSPKTLLESDRYICEICNKGFQRDQNLQLHRRGHNLPWKLLKRETQEVKKRVFVCPEPTCLRHDPCHALGDLVGIKKHFRRKHSNHKQWVCDKCNKGYAAQSDYKAHLKTCGTRGHSCDCGRVFSRVESFIEHQDACTMRHVQPELQTLQPACSSRIASSTSPSSDANFSIAPPLSGLPLAKPDEPVFFFSGRSNNPSSSSHQEHNLELQLLPSSSTSAYENYATHLKLSIGSSDRMEKNDESNKNAIETSLEAARVKEYASNYLLSDEAIKLENVQEPGSIHFQGDTTNHPFDIEKQTPAPQTSSQFIPLPDSSSLTSMRKSKPTTSHKELISNCAVDDLWLHLKGNHSYEYLEFDSCSFPLFKRLPTPIIVQKLKITNCVDTEQVFTVLMDPNLSVESLEIDSCSSFCSMSTGDTAHHSLNLTKQSSSPHRFLPVPHSADKILGVTTGKTLEEYLEIDSCPSKASLLKRESATTSVKQLKICKCEDLGFLLDLMVHNSLEYLEFDSCLFHPPPPLIHFPITLKKLKITNCVNSEHVLAGLVDQKGLSLESLEIDNCSSLLSFPIDKLPATLRQLKIVSCMNLKLFSQSSEIKNNDSVSFGLGGDSCLPNITSTSTLELRELVIWDCEELHSLPEGLHNLTHLELLSLSNCSSLMYFPEGGLPDTCLKSLLISECDNLRSLPNQLHMVTSLQNLTVCGCPCLMSFPEGGLPPNLVSLHIIDCENLISLSYWDLHNLNHLKKYSFIGGCPDLGE